MKSLFLLSLLVSLISVRAASTNAPATNPPPVRVAAPLVTEAPKLIQSSTLLALEPKPNEISLGKTKISGIAVEVVKTGQPLKLINPLSPPVNSSPEDNVVRDPFNGKVTGVKLFAIHF